VIVDPVMYRYESAMTELINNQQMALAGLLAAATCWRTKLRERDERDRGLILGPLMQWLKNKQTIFNSNQFGRQENNTFDRLIQRSRVFFLTIKQTVLRTPKDPSRLSNIRYIFLVLALNRDFVRLLVFLMKIFDGCRLLQFF
jgi:hypothetical protein